jgi:hypothetical protein
MRKELILVFTVFILVSLTAITGVYAFEEKAKIITLSKNELDITGDGLNEVIYLMAQPYQDKHSYFKKIYIQIKASNHRSYKIPLESGINPKLKFVDLNHDSVKDLFVSIPTGGSGDICTNYIYSLKAFKLINLTVPEPLEVDSRFENDYKANIKIAQTNTSYSFDLKDRKKYYEKLGLFYNGKLNEPTELSVNSFNQMKPALFNENQLGLKGVQRITGAANADTIANVESSWLFEDGHWRLIKVDVFRDAAINK